MIMHPVPIKEPCLPHQPSAQVKPCERLGVIGGGLRLGTTTPSICMEFRTRKKVIHAAREPSDPAPFPVPISLMPSSNRAKRYS
jgi:hypothetical protein